MMRGVLNSKSKIMSFYIVSRLERNVDNLNVVTEQAVASTHNEAILIALNSMWKHFKIEYIPIPFSAKKIYKSSKFEDFVGLLNLINGYI